MSERRQQYFEGATGDRSAREYAVTPRMVLPYGTWRALETRLAHAMRMGPDGASGPR
jgi:hypothetical protein